MNNSMVWKTGLAAILLSAALAPGAGPVQASAAEPAAVAADLAAVTAAAADASAAAPIATAPAAANADIATAAIAASAAPVATAAAAPAADNYGLTEQIRAAIKNVSAVPDGLGFRLSATVRLYNGGDEQVRVPEHELRVKTREGASYALVPSAGNKSVLQSREVGELVYSALVDSKEITGIAELSFVHVNLYVYPKTETNLLTMPVGSAWYGVGNEAADRPERLAWGSTFRLPGVNSEIVYTPVEATVQQAGEERAAVVTLLAENTGAGRETIPPLRLDAVTADSGTREGRRSGSGATALEAGEKAYLHYVIQLDASSSPSDLLVVTTDTFAGASGELLDIATGKWLLGWPTNGQTATGAPLYAFGSPITFDAVAKTVDKQTEVSLMEFHIHENPGEGYRTAVAKFRLIHRGELPVAAPAFGSELTDERGVTYRGARQANAVATLNPDLAYVVSYSYMLPQAEEASRFALKLTDRMQAAPYATTIASVAVEPQQESEDQTVSLYPFELKLNSVQVGFLYNAGSYHYKFHLDLDVQQVEPVVVDAAFSRLRFEIVDNVGRVVGSQDAVLAGDKKLISGKQVLEAVGLFSDQLNTPFSINVYEVIDTESGTAKRLLKQVQ